MKYNKYLFNKIYIDSNIETQLSIKKYSAFIETFIYKTDVNLKTLFFDSSFFNRLEYKSYSNLI